MTHLRDVERHARSLADIREIMNSMKSLAYMEARKLQRIVDAQRASTANIRAAATDFLTFQRRPARPVMPAEDVYVLFGTERGFCGNLNEQLIASLRREIGERTVGTRTVIAVGRKLHGVLENRPLPIAELRLIEGAGVADEALAVLNGVVAELDALQRSHGALRVQSLHHGSEGSIARRTLLPTFDDIDLPARGPGHPPILNLDPDQLLVALGDQYLLSTLFEIIYGALRAENLHRVTHLGDAVRHLDDKTADLARRANALRQEEITEEIEVILLSAGSI